MVNLTVKIVRKWWVLPVLKITTLALYVVSPFVSLRWMDNATTWIAEMVVGYGFKLETV